MAKNNKRKRKKVVRVSVRAERRSEPDWDRFAWALLQYTKSLSRKQRPKP
jgi:hypothetical protein